MLNICKRTSLLVGFLLENQVNELSKTLTEIIVSCAVCSLWDQ